MRMSNVAKMFMNKRIESFGKSKGQGVIEYAGALVVAAILISLAMTSSFGTLAPLFNNIFTAVQSFIATALATL